MDPSRDLARAAALIGDPSRAAMLWSLLGGESRPAGELALIANVSPQTASNHLRQLVAGGLVRMQPAGRHRFYRLVDRRVASALESLAAACPDAADARGAAERRAPDLAFARVCYDHLAGRLGVAIFDGLRAGGHLRERGDDLALTAAGAVFFEQLGVDVGAARAKRRRFAFGCPDWSERRPHLGGALGAALLERLLRAGDLARLRDRRGLRLTMRGEARLRRQFGLSVSRAGGIAPGRRRDPAA